MIELKLPDASGLEVEEGSSALEVIKKISEGLARKAVAARVNGEVFDCVHMQKRLR